MWTLTEATSMRSRVAISLFERSCRIGAATSRSRRVSRCRWGLRLSSEQLCETVAIEADAANHEDTRHMRCLGVAAGAIERRVEYDDES